MNTEEELLAGGYDHYEAINDNEYEEGKIEYTNKQEVKFVLKSSVPLVLAFFLQYLLAVTSIFAAGKLGPQELAAASLAVCTFNISGLAIYQGMATSLDSLCSQAYGSGKPHNVGLLFQRCSLIMLVTSVPLAIFWWNSGMVLRLFVSDQTLITMCQQYLRITIIGAPGLLFFETGKRFLQAQHLFNTSTYILMTVAPLNLLLNWIFVWHPKYGLGFIGAPIVVAMIYWTISLMMLLYVVFIDGKQCWGGLQLRKAMKNWGPTLKLAIPGVIMVEAEYLAFEVLTVLAASFGTEALAAQSIASNAGSLAFQLPFAVAVAVSTRIGHFLGRNNTKAASSTIRIAFMFAEAISLINFSIMFFGRDIIGRIFTKSPEVLKISNHILILVSVNQLPDAFNVLGAGILRGQGRQRIGSLLNMVSYYVIALPLGYVLAFKFGFGLAGLWWGLIWGVFFLALSETICIIRSDWSKILRECTKAQDS